MTETCRTCGQAIVGTCWDTEVPSTRPYCSRECAIDATCWHPWVTRPDRERIVDRVFAPRPVEQEETT